MPSNIEHEMTISEVENKLKELSYIVDDEFVKAVEEARKYLDERRGMGE